VRRVRLAARAVGLLSVVAFAAVAFTPVAGALAAVMVSDAELPHADAVVVLGAGVMPEGELDDNSLRRTVHGIRLFRRGLAPRLVLLGPEYRGVVEAEVRARYAADLGVPASAMVVEPDGFDTRGEGQVVAARLGPGAHILLVTGLSHMPRARRAFEEAGLRVTAAPVLEDSAATVRPQGRLSLARAMAQEALARAFHHLPRAR
jgi:uncharacterized SAM-binding protein YcdF (DUF218 family)